MGIHVDQYRDFIEAAKKNGATTADIPRLRREFLKTIGIQVQEELPLAAANPEAQELPVEKTDFGRKPINPGRTKKEFWYDRF